MPHAAVKLIPGLNQNETPALNQTGISVSNLIRFIYDQQLGGLIQKLGGWTKFNSSKTVAPVRALWAWEDTNVNSHLALGTQNIASTTTAQLAVITNPTLSSSIVDITPQASGDNITPVASSTAGSPIILITDTTIENLTNYDTAYITTHLSIGGVVLYGLYPIDQNGFISPTQYNVVATNVLGNPLPAAYTSASTIASFTGSISSTTLTIPGAITGTLYPGQVLLGTGIATNTIILAQITATTWQVSISQTVGSESMTTQSVVLLPLFNVTNASNQATVTLPNHGYNVGDTFPVIVTTTIGGITFYGNYIVQSVLNTSQFIINGSNTASSTTSGYLNGGNAQYIYSFGVGAIPVGTGYGVLGYGLGGYGSGTAITPSTGTPISASTWSLDNWGQILISCAVSSPTAGTITTNSPQFQPIYQWDPTGGNPTATIIPQGPPVNDGFFVAMPQRQIVAWGSTFTGVQDPLLIRWCDVNNYNSWIATVINQAGSYRIPKGSKIVGCLQSSQQALIWTDIGVWSMQYIGPPYVYSFNEIGTTCGLIARKAAASFNGVVYWMGRSQFYSLTGSGVTPVACPAWDVIFQDLDTTNLDKIRTAVNSLFGEITWYYPTISDGGEVNAYIKYNAYLQTWDFGNLGRSAWIDQSVLGSPIGADPNTLYIYQHENYNGQVLFDADGSAMNSYFTTGYFTMAEADLKTFVDQVWPDMKWGLYGGTQNANVNLTFNYVDYPGDTPQTSQTYTLTQATQYVSPRFRGRLTSITLGSSDVGSFWRIGNIRYRMQPDGKF